MEGVIDSRPQSRVSNSQPEGIGRVATLPGICAWNNLGRNIVFADERLRVLALYDETEHPDEDELSQFDLDVHAVVDLPGHDMVAVLNHLGRLRLFRRSDIVGGRSAASIRPERTLDLVDDVERLVAVDGRLVGSRPRREHAGGVFVSETLGAAGVTGQIGFEVVLESIGEVTALCAWPPGAGQGLVVGAEGAVRVVATESGRPRPGQVAVEVGFRPMAVAWYGGLVWSAGPEPSADIDDYDWEGLGGGGFVGFDPQTGDVMVKGEFPMDLAWGNGGVAVGLVPGALWGIGRRGEIVVFDARHGRHLRTSERAVAGSLGIAHAAVVGGLLVFGGNRDGYRLHVRPLATVAA